ncbi:hypothetical protein BBO99_00001719 [Phytophthora kernoviae]|uniref:HECT-type E3 ubiquitin transferase n=1 Tax=Phytophthora kernoviae TaxID=325452 RepID=A0A3R7G525_9STRA|nr:hypothetical protein BBI17_001529 [Phytophthora kernoviae]RLN83892.1 hypothetical protein BBO99_00001719 [Phytophthora kernoviae]
MEKEHLQFPGYVARFKEEAVDPEVVVLTASEAKSMIVELHNEVKSMKIEAVLVADADALAFATGPPSSRNVDVKGLLELAGKDFPTKFAHFVAYASSLLVPVELEVLKLFLRRDHVVEESIEYFCCMDDTDTRSVVRIDFAEETGVDAGGVHREWFALVTELIVNPALGVFNCANHDTQTYFFNANSAQTISDDHLGYFFASGRLVGRALLEGEMMGFHFALALLKIILGIPITFRDFEELDPVAYKGILWMLENDGAETLGLDFTATKRGEGGNVTTVELVPHGQDILVTDSNKYDYAEHWLHYYLLESVSSQLYVFLKGLYQVIPRQLFMLFDAAELDYMICGCDSIDATDWEINSRCSKNLLGTRMLRWFWELVRGMTFEYRRRLLQFATGCSRVPLGGFRHLTSHDGQICPFTVKVWLMACRRNRHLLDLEAPLLSGESVDHRIDAATREAEAGYTVCASCEFENFKRFEYCVLCGDKLSSMSMTTDDEDGAEDGDEESFMPPAYLVASGERPTHLMSPRPRKMSSLSRQQRRARNRKEWSRKLDVEGKLFWYRSSGGNVPVSSAVEAQLPGYTVTFKLSKGEDEKKELEELEELKELKELKELEEGGSDEEPARESEPVLAIEQPQDDKESNENEFKILPSDVGVELVEASVADPAEFATGKSTLVEAGPERRKEIVSIATSDFPSKYAHFVVNTAALIIPAEIEFLKLSVHREYMLEESMDHMFCIQPKNLRSFMRINFLDESGVDAGGVHREWFMLVNELLASSTLRLFICTNNADQSYFLNPQSRTEVGEDHLAYYFATGRLIGRALLEGGIWGFHLALPLLKIILGVPVTLADMEFLDPEAYRSLRWLMDNDDVDDLGLDFSLTEQISGSEKVVVDLIPNGRNVAVTDANKQEYLDRRFRYVLFESVADQLHAFLTGLYEVIPRELLLIFDPEEFDYLLCGSPEIDVTDWQTHAVLSPNLEGANVTNWFWEIVRHMPNEYRRRLLLFATGSACVPLSGFRGLTSYDGRLCPFNLKGVSYRTTQYISSHACFNRLDLPLYHSKRELKKMLYATLDTDLTGFTTA